MISVTFKCFGCEFTQQRLASSHVDMAMSQALSLTADLKLGWYTSIPPREMFACQILGTVLGCFANCQSLTTGSRKS